MRQIWLETKPQSFQNSLQLRSGCIYWDRRRPYLFGREETNKIKNPSISADEDDVIPRAGMELERSVTHGLHVDSAKSSKHDIWKLPLMMCDWRRLCTQENFSRFFFLFSFLFCFFCFSSSDSLRLTHLAAQHKDRCSCCGAAVGQGFLSGLKGRGPTWMSDVYFNSPQLTAPSAECSRTVKSIHSVDRNSLNIYRNGHYGENPNFPHLSC